MAAKPRDDDFPTNVCRSGPRLGAKAAVQHVVEEAVPAWHGESATATLDEPLADFDVLDELGRGAEGRVYLARQRTLADRRVVLKVTECAGEEHFNLARLQHTHIVPLYSVQEDREHNRRVLCMPYFGRATFRDVLRHLEEIPVARRSGRDILHALDRTEEDDAACELSAAGELAPRSHDTPARKYLASADYVEAVCWLGACLADALQFAHERDLVHLDIKPSNILLAADGQPMLLDFHLARPPLKQGEPPPAWLGGSIGYMSSEQHGASLDTLDRQPLRQDVDGRADLFSLGMFLYEALSGRYVLALEQPLPPLSHWNEQISVGLSDIIERCVKDRPADRYATASALAADLRRHVAHEPLRGVPNRSLPERWSKWRKRQPHALPMIVVLVALTLAVLGGGLLANSHRDDQRQQAEQALLDGQNLLRQGRFEEARQQLARGVELASGWTGQREVLASLRHHHALAERAKKAAELHELAENLRPLFITRGQSLRWLSVLESNCRRIWADRANLSPATTVSLEPTLEARIRRDLLELVAGWMELQRRTGKSNDMAALQEAVSLFGPHFLLDWAGQRNERALQQARPIDAWEAGVLGCLLLHAGHIERAQAQLENSLAAEPEEFWTNFYCGACAHARGRYAEAAAAFSVCVGQNPGRVEALVERGRAFAALGNLPRAYGDFEQALRVRPQLSEALLQRGLLNLEQKRFDDALTDLTMVRDQHAEPVKVRYHLAFVHLALSQFGSARVDFEELLRWEAFLRRAGR